MERGKEKEGWEEGPREVGEGLPSDLGEGEGEDT